MRAALANLGKRDRLKNLLQQRQHIAAIPNMGRDDPAQQFLAATPPWDQADTEFNQAHIRFSRRYAPCSRQRDLGSTAEHSSKRRRHHGLGGEAKRLQQILELLGPLLDQPKPARLHRADKQAEISANTKIRSLVSHHQSAPLIAFQQLKRGVAQLDDLRIDGIRFGMEFEAQHAVAKIEQARRFITLKLALAAMQFLKQNSSGRSFERNVASRLLIIYADHPPAHALIKRRAAMRQHLVDPGRYRNIFLPHQLRRSPHTQRVPHLEGTHLGIEAPAHRVVDLAERVGYFGHTPRRIGQDRQRRIDDVVACAITGAMPKDRPQPFAQLRELAHLAHQVKAHLLRRLVLARLHVEYMELSAARALGLFVESGAGLVAKGLGRDQPRDDLQQPECFTALVFGHGMVQIVGHMRQHVQANQIAEPECRSFGITNQWTRQRIHFRDGVAVLHCIQHPDLAGIGTDAVGDEVGPIFGDNRAFAELLATPLPHKRHDLGLGLRRWDQLQQLKVARRVEEVRAQKVRPKLSAASGCNLLNRYARRVARHNRLRLAKPIDPCHQRLLGHELLNNHLDNPVGIAQLVEVVLQVAERDKLGGIGGKQRGRLGLKLSFPQALDDSIANLGRGQREAFGRILRVQLAGRDIQQRDRQAGAGDQRGNAAAHSAGTDHRNTIDFKVHAVLLCTQQAYTGTARRSWLTARMRSSPAQSTRRQTACHTHQTQPH